MVEIVQDDDNEHNKSINKSINKSKIKLHFES